MSVTLVQANAGKTANGANPTSITPAFTGASTTGNQVVLVVGSDNTVATPSGWVLDNTQVNSSAVYVYRRTSAGETTFTAVPTTAGGTAWFLLELAGCAASPKDGTAALFSSAQPTGNVVSTGTTGALAQTDEMAIAVWCYSALGTPTTSWGSETGGYAEVFADQLTQPLSGARNCLAVATKSGPLSATETSSATLTTTATGNADCLIITYKATAVTAKTLSDSGAATDTVGLDTTPPTDPTNLITTRIGSTDADLSWTASTDDIGIAGYELVVQGP